jgi:hypothetical protein
VCVCVCVYNSLFHTCAGILCPPPSHLVVPDLRQASPRMAVLTIVVSGAAPPNPTRFAGCREGVEVEGQAGSLDGLLWVCAVGAVIL